MREHGFGQGLHVVGGHVVPALAEPVLAHRLLLDAEAEFDGVSASSVIGRILVETPPPRSDQDQRADVL